MSVQTRGAGILSWLDRDDWPGDVYELLGRKRFDPNIAAMCDEVTSGAREIFPFQTHADPNKAMRAMRLLTEFVGRAADVLASAEKVGEENDRLYEELRTKCGAEFGDDPVAWKRDALLMWLSEDAGVHAKAVDEIAKVLQADDQATAKKRSKIIHPEIADDVEKPVMPIILEPTPEPEAPVILEPAIVAQPDPPAAAPVILAAIVEDPPPRPKPKPAANRPVRAAVVEEDRAATPRAVAPKLSAAERRHAARRRAAEAEPEKKSGRVIALVAMMVGLPLLLLAGALVWKFYPTKSDDTSVAKNEEKSQESDGDRDGKTRDDGKTDIGTPVAKTQRERFADLLADAKRTPAQPARREKYKQALAIATTTSQKAQVYFDLATDRDYVASLSVDDAKTAIDTLSRDSISHIRIRHYADRFDRKSDLKSLLEQFHARLSRGVDRDAVERALPPILENRLGTDVFTVAETIEESVRAYNAVTSLTVKQSLPGALSAQLSKRRKSFEGMTALTARLEKSPTDDASAAFLKKLIEDATGGRTERNASQRKTIYAAAAAVGRQTSSSLTRSAFAKSLLAWVARQDATNEAAAYFRQRVEKDTSDKFAAKVLSGVVEEMLKQAKTRTGAARVKAYDDVWQLTAAGESRAKLAETIVADAEFMKSAGFKKGLTIHEAIVAHYADPRQKKSAYSLSTKVKALLRFAEDNQQLDALAGKYVAALKTSKDTTVPQAVVNEVARRKVAKARPKLGANWIAKDYTAIETALQHADTEMRSSLYDSLMTDIGFIRGLTFKDYLRTEERIIAGSTSATRTAGALRRMTLYLNSLRSKSKNPAARRRAIIGRWKNARTHLQSRLKEDKNNKAAAKMLDTVERALSSVTKS